MEMTEDPALRDVLADDGPDLDLDPGAAAAAAAPWVNAAPPAVVPPDVRVWGYQSAAWALLSAWDLPLTVAEVKRALRLRALVVAGRWRSLGPDDARVLHGALAGPHLLASRRGGSLVEDLVAGNPHRSARWAWTVLAAWLEHQQRLATGRGAAGDYPWADVLDRGALEVPAPPGNEHVDRAPPAAALKVWGEAGVLYQVWQARPAARTAGALARAALVGEALRTGDPGSLEPADLDGLARVLAQGSAERGFVVRPVSDILWSWLAALRWLEARRAEPPPAG